MAFPDARGTPPPSDRLMFAPPGLQHQWLASRSPGHHLTGAGRSTIFSFGDEGDSNRRPEGPNQHFAAATRDQMGPSMVLDSRVSESKNSIHLFADNYRGNNVDMQYLRHNQTGSAPLDSKAGIVKVGKKQLKEIDAIEYLNLVIHFQEF
jgi:hypothetical protein